MFQRRMHHLLICNFSSGDSLYIQHGWSPLVDRTFNDSLTVRPSESFLAGYWAHLWQHLSCLLLLYDVHSAVAQSSLARDTSE